MIPVDVLKPQKNCICSCCKDAKVLMAMNHRIDAICSCPSKPKSERCKCNFCISSVHLAAFEEDFE